MADCALCGHPRDEHAPRCTRWVVIPSESGEPMDPTDVEVCGCPYEPPEDEEND